MNLETSDPFNLPIRESQNAIEEEREGDERERTILILGCVWKKKRERKVKNYSKN